MIPGEVSSTLSASYSPLAPARNRTAITQFRLNSYVVKTGIYNNTLIGLLLSIIDLGEPLIHADDRRHAGRRSQHADVPRTPVTHFDDAAEFRLVALRITPPRPGPASSAPLWSFACFGALPISAWNGIPA
jgi:hypothetical protein